MSPPWAARLALVTLACACQVSGQQSPPVSFSAGFSDYAVLQRSATVGARLYGFASTDGPITATVAAFSAAHGQVTSYNVSAEIYPWTSTSGCNSTSCIDGRTPLPPAHGEFTWVAQLRPQPLAGGSYSITVSAGDGPNETIALHNVTFGDVYLCSGVVLYSRAYGTRLAHS